MPSLKELAIRRKQRLSHAEFERLWQYAREIAPDGHMEQLEDTTLTEIRAQYEGYSAVYAWSGGKDSLVLEHLCAKAGLADGILVLTDLEFPEFVRWVTDYMPPGLAIVKRRIDLEWLRARPSMLFPSHSSVARRWFQVVQHAGQDQHCRSEGLDMLLLGRRRVDGNYVPKDDGIYRSRGIIRYAPLRDWSH